MRFWADRPVDGGPAHKLVRQEGDASPEWWDWRSDQWIEDDVLRVDLMMDTNLELLAEPDLPLAQSQVRGVNSGTIPA